MTIALAMIARDEQRCIARALSSAAPCVDEMIVLDTGSVDDTRAIARAHGAQVSTFTWIDDFSAARNAALDLTRASHVLVLDADEWLTPGSPDPIRIWARSVDGATAGSVRVRSTVHSDGASLSAAVTSVRVIPRSARYRGRVHEHPHGFLHTKRIWELTIEHDGYELEQVNRKQGRNEALLRAALADAPGNPYLAFQLGRERQICGDFDEASKLYLSTIAATSGGSPYDDELKARTLFTLGRAGRYEEALSFAKTFLKDAGLSAEVLFAAGNLFLDLALARPSNATAFVDMAVRAWRTCLDIGEPETARDATLGCGSFLAAENLAAVCQAQGDDAGRVRWAAVAAKLRAEA